VVEVRQDEEGEEAASRVRLLVGDADAAVLTGASFTMLQAVDGVALRWAVDTWQALAPIGRPPPSRLPKG
jgi:hypothetical protein